MSWGDDFRVEHEEFLVETVSQGRPIVVTRFPANLKPFYMKKSDRTAEGFDIIVPMGGEIVGGSLRETDLDKLKSAIDAEGVKKLEW